MISPSSHSHFKKAEASYAWPKSKNPWLLDVRCVVKCRAEYSDSFDESRLWVDVYCWTFFHCWRPEIEIDALNNVRCCCHLWKLFIVLLLQVGKLSKPQASWQDKNCKFRLIDEWLIDWFESESKSINQWSILVKSHKSARISLPISYLEVDNIEFFGNLKCPALNNRVLSLITRMLK